MQFLRSLLVIYAVVVTILATGCGSSESTESPADLAPLPELSLESFEAAIRDQLETRRRELEELPASTGIAERAMAWGELGRLHHAYELYEVASVCYRNALALSREEENVAGWFYYLGRVDLARGETEGAAASLEQAAQIAPDDTAIRVALGEALFELGRLEDAVSAFEAATRLDPTAVVGHVFLGQIAAEQGELDKAIESYQRVLAAQPSATRTHRLLAAALRAAGDSERANRHLALAGDGEVAFGDPWMYELQGLTVGARSHLDRGSRAFARGRVDEAAAEFRRAVAADPTNAVSHLNLGSALVRLGQIEAAEEAYRESLRLDPSAPRVHFNLGTLLSATQRHDEAVVAFEEALRLDPGYRAAAFNLANSQLVRGRFEEALAHFESVTAADPANNGARRGAVTSLSRLGRDAEALERLEAALELAPGERGLTEALVRILAASPDDTVRDGARALELAKALVDTQTDLQVIEALAMAHAEQGELADALRWQQAAIGAARDAGRPDLAKLLEGNLAAYSEGHPAREPWAAGYFGG